MGNGKSKRILLENYLYHLITRGNQKQKVFKCEEDNNKYLKLLKKFKRKYSVRIYAYCLMPNHVHLLGEIEDSINLSRFMHDLNRTYTLYFNERYKEVGHLWQGRFRSRIVSKDQYVFDCIIYIEFNPVRANLVQKPSEYPWSSYQARILNKKDLVIDNLPSF